MKVVTLLSGGLDSTILMHWLLNQPGTEVRAIGFNYGQRHVKELMTARGLAARANVPFEIVDLRDLARLLPGSSQTDLEVNVPHGRYDEESMKATVVPNRNMIMLSIAAGHALAHRFDRIAYAAHAGDHAIYPDCRPQFVEHLNEALSLCDWAPMEIWYPFIDKTKAEILSIGLQLKVDVGATFSCYEGESVHCGRCGTCIERRQSFYLCGPLDPTVYAKNAPSVEELVKNDWHLA